MTTRLLARGPRTEEQRAYDRDQKRRKRAMPGYARPAQRTDIYPSQARALWGRVGPPLDPMDYSNPDSEVRTPL